MTVPNKVLSDILDADEMNTSQAVGEPSEQDLHGMFSWRRFKFLPSCFKLIVFKLAFFTSKYQVCDSAISLVLVNQRR